MTGAPRNLAICRPTRLHDLVRIGRDHDGGYVLPQRVIDATAVVVGLGINDDWSFEEHFLRRQPKASIEAFDGSVSAAIFRARARGAALESARMAASGELCRARRGITECRELFRVARAFDAFFCPPNRFHQRYVGEAGDPLVVDWATILSLLPTADPAVGDLFVKMDIEGAEYRILGDVARAADRIAGMVVEFHDLDLLWERFQESIDLLRAPFEIVHVHGNNYTSLIPGTPIPRTLEITFMNRRLRSVSDSAVQDDTSYPIAGLDQPNVAGRPDYPLHFG